MRESIANSDDTWEDQLVVGFHRLARAQRRLPNESGREIFEQWEDRLKAFHMLLLDRCGSSWLLGFCSSLMDEAVRYRNLSMNSNPGKLRRDEGGRPDLTAAAKKLGITEEQLRAALPPPPRQ